MKMEFSGNRRTFLKRAAIFSGLALLVGAGKPAASKAKQPSSQPESSGKGYRETEHVKKYYETARL